MTNCILIYIIHFNKHVYEITPQRVTNKVNNRNHLVTYIPCDKAWVY